MLSKLRRFKQVFAVAAIGIAVSLMAVDFAEARRSSGGSFGSRGTRTYSAPAATNTAPGAATGINRSMTPNTNQNAASPAAGAGAQAAQQRRPGMFGGMAGGLLGGLALGGLFGMMMGNGFGGMAGMFGMLLQIALIAGLAMLAFRFFARRQQQAAGPAGGYGAQRNSYEAPRGGNGSNGGNGGGQPGFQIPKMGGLGGGAAAAATAAPRQAGKDTDEIGITNNDLEQFQKLLVDVQSAYGAEDYAKLRALTTPEAMSYLAEELGENATAGVKNDVKDVELLQGDLSESWRENGLEFATVAMRYSSIDVMRDRNNGRVVEGDENATSETVEIWTFVRKTAGEWQLSAIQAA